METLIVDSAGKNFKACCEHCKSYVQPMALFRKKK